VDGTAFGERLDEAIKRSRERAWPEAQPKAPPTIDLKASDPRTPEAVSARAMMRRPT
jgi:hypothetical protein